MPKIRQGADGAEVMDVAAYPVGLHPSATGDLVGDEPAVETEPVAEVEVPDYDTWTLAALRTELGARELSTSGNKAELVMRLQADDLENARPADGEGVDGTVRS
jgi:hypothetical protein